MEFCEFANQSDDRSTKDATDQPGSDSQLSKLDAIKWPTKYGWHAQPWKYPALGQYAQSWQHAKCGQHTKYEQHGPQCEHDAEEHPFFSSTRSTEQSAFK